MKPLWYLSTGVNYLQNDLRFYTCLLSHESFGPLHCRLPLIMPYIKFVITSASCVDDGSGVPILPSVVTGKNKEEILKEKNLIVDWLIISSV